MKDESLPSSAPVEKEEKNRPDFPLWLKSEEGKGCMRWPISEPKYLQNRLFWAFDAGRNCVWDQYMKQQEENARLRSLIEKAFFDWRYNEKHNPSWEQFKKDNNL